MTSVTKIEIVDLKQDKKVYLAIEPLDTVEYMILKDLIESKNVEVSVYEWSDFDLKTILKTKKPDMYDVLESKDYSDYLDLVKGLRADWVLTEGEYNYMRKVLR